MRRTRRRLALVLATVATERDLDGAALVDEAASDGLADLVPKRLPDPAPLHDEFDAAEAQACGAERDDRVRPLGLPAGTFGAERPQAVPPDPAGPPPNLGAVVRPRRPTRSMRPDVRF